MVESSPFTNLHSVITILIWTMLLLARHARGDVAARTTKGILGTVLSTKVAIGGTVLSRPTDLRMDTFSRRAFDLIQSWTSGGNGF